MTKEKKKDIMGEFADDIKDATKKNLKKIGEILDKPLISDDHEDDNEEGLNNNSRRGPARNRRLGPPGWRHGGRGRTL